MQKTGGEKSGPDISEMTPDSRDGDRKRNTRIALRDRRKGKELSRLEVGKKKKKSEHTNDAEEKELLEMQSGSSMGGGEGKKNVSGKKKTCRIKKKTGMEGRRVAGEGGLLAERRGWW